MAKKGSPKRDSSASHDQRIRQGAPGELTAETLHKLAKKVAEAFYNEELQVSEGNAVDLISAALVESDRGLVLVMAEIIDDGLAELLTAFFLSRSPNSGGDIKFFLTQKPLPPLQSTALKIRMAFMLGLIEEKIRDILVDLQSLRSIVAAHSRKALILTRQHIDKIISGLPETESPRIQLTSIVGMVLAVMEDAQQSITAHGNHK